MTIPIGTRIGPYEISGWIGAGAMGEVYRARDPRLGRDVAVKVIADAYAADAARLARFEQEARAAGRLNHPNVLAVHDCGVHNGTAFIVSELLEGESLRQRLRQGPLPVRKALEIARQIADGLAAAHDKGIVHRDLKPDNVFITSDGRTKILDFGLAKLTQPLNDAGPTALQDDTEPGTVLGTVGYMSPEQVRGEPVDARSDIFSFGTILHEMLTGRSPFARGSAAETMAAILNDDPIEPLSSHVSPAVERIAARCLEKSREARFQSARDLSFGLEVLSGSAAVDSPIVKATPFDWIGRRPLLWMLGAIAVAAVIGVPVFLRTAPAPPEALRLSVNLGASVPLSAIGVQFGDLVALSADGSTIAFTAQVGRESEDQLFVRKLNALTAVPLAGTERGLLPFFSPDGKWLGFFAGGKLKKIALTGGAPITLADAPDHRGGWWGDDGVIVFAPDRRPGTRIMRVSENGGEVRPLTAVNDETAVPVFPQVLPGGHSVLFTTMRTPGSYNDASLMVQSIDGGAARVVQAGGFHGRYLASGHLIFIHAGTLLAVPFDLDRLEVTGPPVPVLESVMSNAITGGAQFTVSRSGTLAYLPGPSVGGALPLHLIDGQGGSTTLKAPSGNWLDPRFSPDGGRLAMEIRANGSDIWVLDLERETFARMTSTPAAEVRPVWTGDGRRLAFGSSANQSAFNVYWTAADGSSAVERLTTSANQQQPSSWHPSGKFLAFEETVSADGNTDVMILPMEGSDASGWTPGTPTVFVNGLTREVDAVFSPDGRWLAYGSLETGQSEVFVRPFPGPGPRYQVSIGGGALPVWSRARPELFYGINGNIMIAEYSVAGGTFRSEKPRQWTQERFQFRGPNRMYDVHPDGKHVALAPIPKAPANTGRDSVVLIFNFFEDLRRVAKP